MRKIFKQTASIALAAAMVFTMAPVASADDTVTVKPGLELEGYVDKHVYDVTLPTVPTGEGVKTGFEFVADPQGLLSTADKTTYPDGAGAVYFQTKAAVEADDTATPAVTASPAEFSADSKDITIINNSSFDVEVSLNVDVKTDGSGLTIVEEADLATATAPSLYLGLIKRGTADSETAVATSKTSKETLAKIGEAVFDTDGSVTTEGYAVLAMSDADYTDSATTDDEKKGYSETASPSGYHYKYGLTDGYDAETDGTKLSYAITGACDSKADWSKVDTTKVDINMVWTIKDPAAVVVDATPTMAVKTATYSKADGAEFAIDFGKGTLAATDVKSVTIGGAADSITGEYKGTVTADAATGKVTVTGGSWASAANGSKKYMKITMNDKASTEFVVELTIAD